MTDLSPAAVPPVRILVAPDSFKGSLDAAQVAERMAAGLLRALPRARIHRLPMADGGEGTAAAVFAALGGEWHRLPVTDANGDASEAPCAVCRSPAIGPFAVLDAASVVGLPQARAAPGARTTRGLGEALRRLHAQGLRTVALGLGGSSTNDAGAGLLAETALDFLDADGAVLSPTFDSLPRAVRAQPRADAAWIGDMRLIALTDVDSPLTGPRGASRVFGGQKGHTDLDRADAVLGAAAGLCEAALGRRTQHLPGAGAAGGLGFALGLLGAELVSGAEFLGQVAELDRRLRACDWVLTGEGRSDAQTLMGKGPGYIAGRARAHGVPVTLLSGAVQGGDALDALFDGCFSIADGPLSLDEAIGRAGPLLEQASYRLARLYASLRAG
jgi:glycerate kinase